MNIFLFHGECQSTSTKQMETWAVPCRCGVARIRLQSKTALTTASVDLPEALMACVHNLGLSERMHKADHLQRHAPQQCQMTTFLPST